MQYKKINYGQLGLIKKQFLDPLVMGQVTKQKEIISITNNYSLLLSNMLTQHVTYCFLFQRRSLPNATLCLSLLMKFTSEKPQVTDLPFHIAPFILSLKLIEEWLKIGHSFHQQIFMQETKRKHILNWYYVFVCLPQEINNCKRY